MTDEQHNRLGEIKRRGEYWATDVGFLLQLVEDLEITPAKAESSRNLAIQAAKRRGGYRLQRNEYARAVVGLYDAIKHGDEKHRAWLKEKVDAHFQKAKQHLTTEVSDGE